VQPQTVGAADPYQVDGPLKIRPPEDLPISSSASMNHVSDKSRFVQAAGDVFPASFRFYYWYYRPSPWEFREIDLVS
jgi:hypothetical protein